LEKFILMLVTTFPHDSLCVSLSLSAASINSPVLGGKVVIVLDVMIHNTASAHERKFAEKGSALNSEFF
jgi:hypothetical protein